MRGAATRWSARPTGPCCGSVDIDERAGGVRFTCAASYYNVPVVDGAAVNLQEGSFRTRSAGPLRIEMPTVILRGSSSTRPLAWL